MKCNITNVYNEYAINCEFDLPNTDAKLNSVFIICTFMIVYVIIYRSFVHDILHLPIITIGEAVYNIYCKIRSRPSREVDIELHDDFSNSRLYQATTSNI